MTAPIPQLQSEDANYTQIDGKTLRDSHRVHSIRSMCSLPTISPKVRLGPGHESVERLDP
jgi:hypothetical protein